MEPRQRWVRALALFALAGALTLARPALAQEKEETGVPLGKMGLSFGVRPGFGTLADSYGWALFVSADAGLHRSSIERVLSIGADWSVRWSWYGFDDLASASGSLRVLDLSFGARSRQLVAQRLAGREGLLFLFQRAGLLVMRTNVPVAPDFERTYLGPYVAAGVEVFVRNAYLVSIAVEYDHGVLSGGPGSVLTMISFGVGR